MKHLFKKAAAAVMAAAILGAGSTFTNTFSPKSNTITASAATVSPNSPHNHGYSTYTRRETTEWFAPTKVDYLFGAKLTVMETFYHYEWNVVRCSACGGVVRKTLDYDKSYMIFYYFDSTGRCTGRTGRMKIMR